MEPKVLLAGLSTDTLKGLSSNPKYLLSKYFYDDAGSAIFQDIMNMPEYYLTDCEHEILSTHKEEITRVFCHDYQRFDLVELGSGDGFKTKILLKQLIGNASNFQYTPVDISANANSELVKSLKTEWPDLQVEAKTGDYFQKLKSLNGHSALRKIILFLGSNIGNFSDSETDEFLKSLSSITYSGDKVLIGFDLKKSPQVILEAYNDPHGHTRRFNLNHLERLNRELDADFETRHFDQLTTYDPVSGEVKSYLVSKIEQTIYVGALEQSFHFNQWEPVFMERSRKYDLQTIEKLAVSYGFKVERSFADSNNYFVDSLWNKM